VTSKSAKTRLYNHEYTCEQTTMKQLDESPLSRSRKHVELILSRPTTGTRYKENELYKWKMSQQEQSQ